MTDNIVAILVPSEHAQKLYLLLNGLLPSIATIAAKQTVLDIMSATEMAVRPIPPVQMTQSEESQQ